MVKFLLLSILLIGFASSVQMQYNGNSVVPSMPGNMPNSQGLLNGLLNLPSRGMQMLNNVVSGVRNMLPNLGRNVLPQNPMNNMQNPMNNMQNPMNNMQNPMNNMQNPLGNLQNTLGGLTNNLPTLPNLNQVASPVTNALNQGRLPNVNDVTSGLSQTVSGLTNSLSNAIPSATNTLNNL